MPSAVIRTDNPYSTATGPQGLGSKSSWQFRNIWVDPQSKRIATRPRWVRAKQTAELGDDAPFWGSLGYGPCSIFPGYSGAYPLRPLEGMTSAPCWVFGRADDGAGSIVLKPFSVRLRNSPIFSATVGLTYSAPDVTPGVLSTDAALSIRSSPPCRSTQSGLVSWGIDHTMVARSGSPYAAVIRNDTGTITRLLVGALDVITDLAYVGGRLYALGMQGGRPRIAFTAAALGPGTEGTNFATGGSQFLNTFGGDPADIAVSGMGVFKEKYLLITSLQSSTVYEVTASGALTLVSSGSIGTPGAGWVLTIGDQVMILNSSGLYLATQETFKDSTTLSPMFPELQEAIIPVAASMLRDSVGLFSTAANVHQYGSVHIREWNAVLFYSALTQTMLYVYLGDAQHPPMASSWTTPFNVQPDHGVLKASGIDGGTGVQPFTNVLLFANGAANGTDSFRVWMLETRQYATLRSFSGMSYANAIASVDFDGVAASITGPLLPKVRGGSEYSGVYLKGVTLGLVSLLTASGDGSSAPPLLPQARTDRLQQGTVLGSVGIGSPSGQGSTVAGDVANSVVGVETEYLPLNVAQKNFSGFPVRVNYIRDKGDDLVFSFIAQIERYSFALPYIEATITYDKTRKVKDV